MSAKRLLPQVGILPWVILSAEYPVDPYLNWAIKTGFRDFGRDGKLPRVVNLIAELTNPLPRSEGEFWAQLLKEESPKDLGIDLDELKPKIPPSYFVRYPGNAEDQYGTKFATLRLDVADGAQQITPELIETKLQGLIQNSAIQRVQLGHSRLDSRADPGAGEKPIPSPYTEQEPSQEGPPVLMGLIDDAFPFAHHAIRLDPHTHGTRVLALWDQTQMDCAPFTSLAPPKFPYGRQWLKDELDQFQSPTVSQDEELRTEAWERVAVQRGRFASLRGRASHGAAVLGAFAGRHATAGLPADGVLLGEGETQPPHEANPNEPACLAPLALVQLPREQTQVSSGRWLAPQVLDALRYLLDWGWSYRRQGQQPALVVNLSYGSQTGPHDGSSILEQAMEEMCCHFGADLAIVLAAGNSHGRDRDPETDTLLPSGVHARAELEKGKVVSFALGVPPDKQTDTAIEIWFDKEVTKDDKVEVRVWKPGSHRAEAPDMSIDFPGEAWLCEGSSAKGGATSKGPVIGGLIGMTKVPQAFQRSMALLMIAPTQMATRHVEAPAGEWIVQVESRCAVLQVDLWVERDDTVVGASRGQQARLLQTPGVTKKTLTDEDTFTHIANGKSTFVVTALQGSDGAGVASDYSSEGKEAKKGTEARLPDLSALVDPLRTAHGIRVMGNRTGVVVRANGTSMAAPQAARWIASRLGDKANLGRIRQEIVAAQRTARVGKIIP